MAGINFILGIDGSKARSQAEAAGKDIKNGIDKSTKGTSKGVDDLSKSLGTARSNAKQLHEDLLGMAAGGTKSMSSMIGLAGDLAKALKSPAGAVTALIATVVAMGKAISEAVAHSADLVRSDLTASLEVARDRAAAINEVNLSKFRKELTGAADKIRSSSELFSKMQALYTEVLDSESQKRIAIIENLENAGVISHEEAEKRKLAITVAYMNRNFEVQKQEREREVREKKEILDAAKKAESKAVSSFDQASVQKEQVLITAGRIRETLNDTELTTLIADGATQFGLLSKYLQILNPIFEEFGMKALKAPENESYLINKERGAMSPLDVADIFSNNTINELDFTTRFEAQVKNLLDALKVKSGEVATARAESAAAEKDYTSAVRELKLTTSLINKKQANLLETVQIEGATNIARGEQQDADKAQRERGEQARNEKSAAEKNAADTYEAQTTAPKVKPKIYEGPVVAGKKEISKPTTITPDTEGTKLLEKLVAAAQKMEEHSKATADNTKGLQPK